MKSTFCFIYNELYTKMMRSKKRKRYWAERISEHRDTCNSCQLRVNILELTFANLRKYNRSTK